MEKENERIILKELKPEIMSIENLVFKGGGVLGIAYAGAIKADKNVFTY